jgi:hypothetical protein
VSSHAILHDISRELRRRIHAALSDTPGTDFDLTTEEGDIVLSPPPEPAAGAPLLSVYLYHVEPDAHLRNQPYLNVDAGGLRYPPLALQLHYLITGLDDQEPTNQLVLGRILQHFHDNPFIGEVAGAPLDNSFGGNSPEARIMLEMLTLEELSRVWQALRSGYQLSLAYRVQVVTVDSARSEVEARRVRELHTAVGTKV